MGIKKISELEELKNLQTTDILPVVDVENGTTKKVKIPTFPLFSHSSTKMIKNVGKCKNNKC